MNERTITEINNMIKVYNHIINYQYSTTKKYNQSETIDSILYQYDMIGCPSSVYADGCQLNCFFNMKKHIKEIMSHDGEYSLYIIYDDNNDRKVKRAFIIRTFNKRAVSIIENKEDTIIQVNPFYPEFYVFDKNKNLIEAYKDTDGLVHIEQDKFDAIKETLNIKDYFR